MTAPSIRWRKDDESGLLRDDPGLPARETTITYCLHCDWEVRAADGYTASERTREAVDHHVATGHAIDSIR